MNIEIKDFLTLDDNIEYTVISKINYENEIYFYLVSNDLENANPKFYRFNGEDELEELEDKNLIQNLLPLFILEAKKHCTPEELDLITSLEKDLTDI